MPAVSRSVLDTHNGQVKTLNAGLEMACVGHFGLQVGLQALSGPVERWEGMLAGGLHPEELRMVCLTLLAGLSGFGWRSDPYPQC
jgi:hypothetical protein